MEVGDLLGGHLDVQVRRQMESREGMVNREQNRRTYALDLYTTVYVFSFNWVYAQVCVENDIYGTDRKPPKTRDLCGKTKGSFENK